MKYIRFLTELSEKMPKFLKGEVKIQMNKENRYKVDVDYSLYLVADSSYITLENAEKSISEAIAGGVTVIQLRAKDISTAEFYNMALKIKMITQLQYITISKKDFFKNLYTPLCFHSMATKTVYFMGLHFSLR